MFHLKKNGTSLTREFVAGLTTFATMGYIIFVNPLILQDAGMDFGAVMVATIIATALSTLIMGLYANYPFVQAPGMGLNAFFTYAVVINMGHSWQEALGASFVAGLLFFLLNLIGFRKLIMEAIPPALRRAITSGMGLFLALIGLKNLGVIVANPNTMVSLGNITAPPVLIATAGLIVTAVMMARGIKGAILLGIFFCWVMGLITGLTQWQGFVALPPSIAPTFLKMDIAAAFKPDMLGVLISFLFIAIFDTAGTLIGLAEHGGFLNKEGKLPRASKALTTDAIGTMVGAACGTSPMTTYLESSAGIEVGGRTGLTATIVAALFILSLFFSPLAASIPFFATAPVLIIIGSMMMRSMTQISWADATESIPAFLVMLTIPLTFSIATGIGIGFLTYPLIKLFCGQGKSVHWLAWILAILFALKFAFIG